MPPLRSGIRHSEERAGLSENPDFGHSFSPNFTKITKNRLKKQISDSDPEAQQDTGKSVQRVFQQILITGRTPFLPMKKNLCLSVP